MTRHIVIIGWLLSVSACTGYHNMTFEAIGGDMPTHEKDFLLNALPFYAAYAEEFDGDFNKHAVFALQVQFWANWAANPVCPDASGCTRYDGVMFLPVVENTRGGCRYIVSLFGHELSHEAAAQVDGDQDRMHAGRWFRWWDYGLKDNNGNVVLAKKFDLQEEICRDVN